MTTHEKLEAMLHMYLKCTLGQDKSMNSNTFCGKAFVLDGVFVQ